MSQCGVTVTVRVSPQYFDAAELTFRQPTFTVTLQASLMRTPNRTTRSCDLSQTYKQIFTNLRRYTYSILFSILTEVTSYFKVLLFSFFIYF